jgi:dienelactone hydrolase
MNRTLTWLILLLSTSTLAQQIQISAPELVVPSDLKSWQTQTNSIREDLIKVLGELPPRPATPSVKILSKENKGSYTLEKFEFDNGAGATVPGYLLLPNNSKTKHPAIYYAHWHGGNYDLGKEEIFQTHHTPVVPAEAFIKNGYAVIAIDAYCFGERSGKGPGGMEIGGAEELTQSKYELWMGRSLFAMMVRDDLMALEYLLSRPEIDSKNVAATGISMGATRTWWLMSLDERIKTGVAVGCLTRYQDLIAEQKLKYHGIYYYVPGILKHFDTEAIISLIAPRPILFMTGDSDPGSPVSGMKKIETVVQKVYDLHGVSQDFKSIIYPETGHVYTSDMWNKMMDWMDSRLK